MFCYVYIFLNKNVLLYIHWGNYLTYVFSTFLFLTVLYSFINWSVVLKPKKTKIYLHF